MSPREEVYHDQYDNYFHISTHVAIYNSSTIVQSSMSTLRARSVAETLHRLHDAAKGDRRQMLKFIPGFLWSKITNQNFLKKLKPEDLKDLYIPVSREEGTFLYNTVLSTNARTIVEFGTSFGISTIYLAAAAKDASSLYPNVTTPAKVITTELLESKASVARSNIEETGLLDYVDIRVGDAMETLKQDLNGGNPIDLVFLDGWKDLYIPLLQQLEPQLRPGATVIADNVDMKDVQPYVDYVSDPANGYSTVLVSVHGAAALSVWNGAKKPSSS